jgi:hypothetical protein
MTIWLSFLLGGSTPGVFSAFFVSSTQTNVSVRDQMVVGVMGELVLGRVRSIYAYALFRYEI